MDNKGLKKLLETAVNSLESFEYWQDKFYNSNEQDKTAYDLADAQYTNFICLVNAYNIVTGKRIAKTKFSLQRELKTL